MKYNNSKEYFDGQSTGVTDEYTWQVNSDNTITITKYSPTSADVSPSGYILIIPSMLNNLPVTIIGDKSFQGNTNFVTVNIPDTVTSIGDSAFSDCSTLKYVAFSDNCQISNIGPSAFKNTSINLAYIPASVTNIGDNAFDTRLLNSVKFLGNRPTFNATGDPISSYAFISQQDNGNGKDVDGGYLSKYKNCIYLNIYKGAEGFGNPLPDTAKFTIYENPKMVLPPDNTEYNPIYLIILVVVILLILVYGAAKIF